MEIKFLFHKKLVCLNAVFAIESVTVNYLISFKVWIFFYLEANPPQIQKKHLMCGVCKTVLQFTPSKSLFFKSYKWKIVSNYVRCVCGTVNYVSPENGMTEKILPPHENFPKNQPNRPQPPGPNTMMMRYN